MQSKTSCFNKTLFRKHVTRFWPVWTAYFVIWLLVLPLSMVGDRERLAAVPLEAQYRVLSTAGGGAVACAAIFAVLMAMGVWSFLYSSRSASGAACLPLTRTAQFTSAALGGFVPLIAVHVVVFLLTALTELSLGALHLPSLLTWLGVTTLLVLFFYGFATFCAMLTGNIIVLPAVYFVLNFTVAGFVFLLNAVAGYFLYGFTGILDDSRLMYLSPVIPLARTLRAESVYETDAVTAVTQRVSVHFVGWQLALIYAAAGVLLLAAAWALLRRRRMEAAGDVVAVQVLKPVFRWCMGIGGALCFACMMFYVFDLSGETQGQVIALTALYLVIGAFIGWFAAEMLIRRSFRAFSGGLRGWGGWAICCAVALLGLAATEFDLLGYERRQPKAEQIEAAVVYADGQGAFFEDPEGIAAALETHRGIIGHKALQDQSAERAFYINGRTPFDESISVRVQYLLKSGGMLERSYTLPHVTGARDDAMAVQDLINRPEAVQARKRTPFPFTEDNIRFGSVNVTMTARECAAAAGDADPADYILREFMGWSPQEIAGMSAEVREEQLRAALAQQYSGYGKFYDGDTVYDRYPGDSDREALPLPDDPEDWDNIWLDYTLELTAAEAWELYSTCILPDSADGRLGRVWILSTEREYNETACAGSVEIVADRPEPAGRAAETAVESGPYTPPTVGSGYASFSTTLTVDALRTRDFLSARGIRFHTPAELRAALRG